MLSEKQLLANRQNALRSTGPRTPEGKAIASRNALKHGLLANTVVINDGEGAEDQQAFDALLADLIEQLQPLGSLEEVLVEKIAVSYWRMRRVHRYEVGMLRHKLDTVSDDYYAKQGHLTDARIDAEIDDKKNLLKTAGDKVQMFSQARTIGQDLSTAFCWKDDWLSLRESHLAPTQKVYKIDGTVVAVVTMTPAEVVEVGTDPGKIRKKLNEKGHSDDQIWQLLMELTQKQTETIEKEIQELQKDKVNNKLRLQRIHQSSSLPSGSAMDNILRYENAIERSLYKALTELHKLQILRSRAWMPPTGHLCQTSAASNEPETAKPCTENRELMAEP